MKKEGLAKILSIIFLIPIIFSLGLATCDPPNYAGNWDISSGEVCTNSSIELNITGDININGSLTLSNSVIVWINDDLNINGNLTIDNTTIRMNGTGDGASTVEVKSTGKLEVNDSIITNGIVSTAGYYFYYRSGSEGFVNNSEMYKAVGGGVNGLVIETDNIKIENNIIADMEGYGIALESGSNNRIYNNIIHDVIDSCIGVDIGLNNDILNNLCYHATDGIYVSESNYTNVLNNEMRDTYVIGITIDYYSNNNLISNNNISNNTWGGIWLRRNSLQNNITFNNITGNGDAGIYIELSGNDSVITDNIINDNANAGIYMSGSSGNLFLRNSLYNNTDGFEVINSDVPLNYFANSIISSSTNNDVLLTTDADVVFVNVTFNKASTSIADTSSLNVTWYMDVTVLDTDTLNPLSGATLTIEDTNNVLRFNGVTNAFGKIATQILNEYEEDNIGKTYFANYDVNASKTGFVDKTNTTSFTSSETVFVILNTFIPTLTGTVRDDCVDSVQEGVTVSNPTLGTNITDSNGIYYLYGSDGTYTLSWRKAGFRSGSKEVTISGDTENNITIRESYCATFGTGDVALSVINFAGNTIVFIGTIVALIVLAFLYIWFRKN